jgi:hypothetical protein
MKRVCTWLLILLGFLFLAVSLANASSAPSPAPPVAGSLLGIVLLIGGLLVWRSEPAPKTPGWLLLLACVVASAFGASTRLLFSRDLFDDSENQSSDRVDRQRLERGPEKRDSGSGTSWTYSSEEYGFSMTLPSRDWRSGRQRSGDLGFHNSRDSILATLQIARQSRDTFLKKAVTDLTKTLADTTEDYVGTVKREEGETEAGNLRVLWTGISKGDAGELFFVGYGLVWCKDKTLTVKMMCESPLHIRSQPGRNDELASKEDTFRKIFFSLR